MQASASLEFEAAAALHAQVQKVEAVRALAAELVRPMSQLRAVISAGCRRILDEVAVFLFEQWASARAGGVFDGGDADSERAVGIEFAVCAADGDWRRFRRTDIRDQGSGIRETGIRDQGTGDQQKAVSR